MRADPKWTGVVTAYEFGLLPLGPVNDGFYKRDPSFPLGELPDLVLYLVMAFLDPKSLTALMKTCRRFYFTGKFHKSWTRKNQKIRIYHRSIEICVLIELLSRYSPVITLHWNCYRISNNFRTKSSKCCYIGCDPDR